MLRNTGIISLRKIHHNIMESFSKNNIHRGNHDYLSDDNFMSITTSMNNGRNNGIGDAGSTPGHITSTTNYSVYDECSHQQHNNQALVSNPNQRIIFDDDDDDDDMIIDDATSIELIGAITNGVGNNNPELVPIAADLTDFFESDNSVAVTKKGEQRQGRQQQEHEPSNNILLQNLFRNTIAADNDNDDSSQKQKEVSSNQVVTHQTMQQIYELRQNTWNIEQQPNHQNYDMTQGEQQMVQHEADVAAAAPPLPQPHAQLLQQETNSILSPAAAAVVPPINNDSIVVRLMSHGNSVSWETRFNELQEFYKEHGHTIVPHNYTPNLTLAQWVKRQRNLRKNKLRGEHTTLTDFRENALNSVNFVWDAHAALWAERWNELLQFKQKYGHCNVPASFADNPKLATWVKCQRRHFRLLRQGDSSSSMTDERCNRLNILGFNWDPRGRDANR